MATGSSKNPSPGYTRAIPESFLCPISRELMENPHMNMVGQTYDLKSISEWLAMGKRADPVTRQPLSDTRLVPNIALRSQIYEWKQRNRIRNQPASTSDCAGGGTRSKTLMEESGEGKAMSGSQEESKVSWLRKPIEKWDCDEVEQFVSQLGSSAVWKEYAEKVTEEKVDGAVLSVMEDIDTAVGFGFSKIHAIVLKKALANFNKDLEKRLDEENVLRKVAREAKNIPPSELKHGIRVLVRTQSSGRICHLEGRLVNFTQRYDGQWELQVDAPLLAPKRRTFIYRKESSEYLIPPTHQLQMGPGARVIGPFPDLTAEGGWAWYEGYVKAWDGERATVQYTDGCVWVARYPESTHMLDIDRSEDLLSLPALAALGKNVEKMPLIVIREGQKLPPEPIRLGTRILVRSQGTNKVKCLLEGRLVDWKETKEGNWELYVDAPLTKPKRHTFLYIDGKPNDDFIIPAVAGELRMSVGARVVGTFDHEGAEGGWAWYEGEVKKWDGTTATVKYLDGTEWETKYPANQQLLDIRRSEQLLSVEAVSALYSSAIPLLVIREAKQPAPKELKTESRILVRSSGMNNGPCLLEGRIKEIKERVDGRWQLAVDAPLVEPRRRILIYKPNSGDYVLPPGDEAKMEVGARVVGCFGDREAEGGWAWYEGDVTDWDGKNATVEYTDGTVWTTAYPSRREMLNIEDSEKLLTTNSVRSLNPARMPLLVLKEAKKGAPQELKTGKRVLVRSTGANGAPCLLEGRLVDFDLKDEGKWEMIVNSPLGSNKRRKFIYSETPSEYIIVSPEKNLQMGIDARVVGCFGDSQAEGGWAWYEGVVMGWAGGRATVMYTDGTTWISKFPPPANLVDIRNSEGLLNQQTVSAMNPEDMPLIVVASSTH